jgi:hypothetical protein
MGVVVTADEAALTGAARPRGRARAALAAVLTLGVVGGCTSSPSADLGAPASATAVPERTSGPLADGIEILDGSALIGTVFEYTGGDGWWAVLRIEGDPRQAMDAYREQFEGVLGVPLLPNSETGCGPELVQPPFELLCRSGAATGENWLGLRMLVSEDDDRAFLQIDRSDAVAAPPEPADMLPTLRDGEVSPATDEPIGSSYGADHMMLRVVEGSRLLADPLPNEGIGYRAVLQVTGDPATVMRGYAAQFKDGATRLLGDEQEILASLDQAGGAHITLHAMLGEPAYILITYDYD